MKSAKELAWTNALLRVYGLSTWRLRWFKYWNKQIREFPNGEHPYWSEHANRQVREQIGSRT